MTPDMIRIAITGAISPLRFCILLFGCLFIFLYPRSVLLQFYAGRYVFNRSFTADD